MTRKIQTLNAISKKGLSRLPDSYVVGNDIADPDAILVRSQVMHECRSPPACWPSAAPAPAPTTSRPRP